MIDFQRDHIDGHWLDIVEFADRGTRGVCNEQRLRMIEESKTKGVFESTISQSTV